MGIGINTGEVVVGNIGSTKRTKYGPMGRNVNLASRIESYTVGGQILVSESTLKACGTIIEASRAIEVMPKGFKQPIIIYEVKGIGGDFNRFVAEKEGAESITLETPIRIGFWEIEEKHVDKNLHRGLVIRMADETLDIQSDSPINIYTDLKIVLLDDMGMQLDAEFYAKVTEILPESPTAFRIHFSFLDQEAKRFLETYLGRRLAYMSCPAFELTDSVKITLLAPYIAGVVVISSHKLTLKIAKGKFRLLLPESLNLRV
jgi:adenylate cyclase